MINKKIYLTLLTICMATILAGAGTWAYFTDTAASTDNKFTSGTLKLEIGENNPQVMHFNFSKNVRPEYIDQPAGVITVKNIGSVNGTLTATLTNVTFVAVTHYWWWWPYDTDLSQSNLKIQIDGVSGSSSNPCSSSNIADGTSWNLGELSHDESRDINFQYSWPSERSSYGGSRIGYQDQYSKYSGTSVTFDVKFEIKQVLDA